MHPIIPLLMIGAAAVGTAIDHGVIQNPFKPKNTPPPAPPVKGTWTFNGPARNLRDADVVLIATSVINGTHTLTPNQFAAIKHELYERGKRQNSRNMRALARQLKNVRLV